jgi:hypothetical protein
MSDRLDAARPFQPVLKLTALALAVAVIGVPVNTLAAYATLAVITVIIFSGAVRVQGRAWLAAAAIVFVAVAGQWLLATPRIDEGHNVFLPGGPERALERGLPSDIYRHLLDEFNKLYLPETHCKLKSNGCWRNGGFPDRAFAFSADGIFHPSDMSRAVTAIDFSDPVWLGLGFVNDRRYNWYTTAPDVHRADQDRRIWMGLHRWHLAMPWFEMIRLPGSYVGGELCWRGDVMWEGADEHFSLWRGDGCRTIEPADAGRRIVGVAIKPDSLAMRLTPPWRIWLLQTLGGALTLAAAFGLIAVLVRFKPRRLILPAILIGLSLLVIAVADASFIGGLRPMEGGDDGLFYDGVGRVILQKFLAGDIFGVLEGGEKVFYYGGPGLRYFRALEHVIFGETYLGYLSLVLLLPFLVLSLFRRFISESWALALAIMFVAVPLGELFGTTFIDYAKWALRGFADPAAYTLFIAGLAVLCGRAPSAPDGKFSPAFFGALLLMLGIAMKPIVAPAAAVFLGGAGLAALYMRQWFRLAGLCIGFLPVFSMALHNWVFGHKLVLFSANASHPLVLVMPPSAYVAAFHELVTLNFAAGKFLRALAQIPEWLSSGPAESYFIVPLSAAGVAILIYVVARGRGFDPWLRLIGAAALAQHAVALFYIGTARYHFLNWFLTMLVVMAFMHDIGIDWLRRRYPIMSERIVLEPWSRRLVSGLSWLQKVSA